MGFFDRFSADSAADNAAGEAAAQALEDETAASLPPGWRYRHTSGENMGSRPARHLVYAAWAEAPDGVVAAFAQDRTGALRELSRLASGHAQPTTGWVLPHIDFQGVPEDFQPGVSNAPDYGARISAWAAAKSCLPAGSVLSGADKETVGVWGTQIYGVTAHLPDGSGLAALATTGPGAYETLSAHLSGDLAVTPTWTIRQAAPGLAPGGHR